VKVAAGGVHFLSSNSSPVLIQKMFFSPCRQKIKQPELNMKLTT